MHDQRTGRVRGPSVSGAYRGTDAHIDEEGEEPSKPDRILIIDDHKMFGESIRSVLEDDGLGVVGSVTTVEQGLEAARDCCPDLVLADVYLPDGCGITMGRRILAENPKTKVLIVTATDQLAATELVRDGFVGYLTKDTPLGQFVKCVKAALDGHIVVRQTPIPRSEGRSGEEVSVQLRIGQLTNREKEVLSLLVKGANGLVISNQLSISPNTVRSHIQNILIKLQVKSRLEAAAFAVRYRVVDLTEFERSLVG